MGGKRVLVVATTIADESELRENLADAGEVRVVTPAVKVSKLDWLTGAEDDARTEADRAAQSAVAAAPTEASVEIDSTSQNTDAAQNVDDALRMFRPDEIVIVSRAGEQPTTWLEDEALRTAVEESGVPVRHLELKHSGER